MAAILKITIEPKGKLTQTCLIIRWAIQGHLGPIVFHLIYKYQLSNYDLNVRNIWTNRNFYVFFFFFKHYCHYSNILIMLKGYIVFISWVCLSIRLFVSHPSVILSVNTYYNQVLLQRFWLPIYVWSHLSEIIDIWYWGIWKGSLPFYIYGPPRWLIWMRRPTGDQEVAGSTPAEVGNILSWRLIMKYILWSFSSFHWFKKGSCQFLAKECAQYWLTA